MSFPIISADSHITEHPNTYVDYIDPKWKDKAPHVVDGGDKGDLFVIDGMDRPVAMGLIAAAGKAPEELTMGGRFTDWPRGGWDPEARMADQDRDGVAAEVIYPSVGMMLCNHKDYDYQKACFDAYNRWIAEYCRPTRTGFWAAGRPRCAHHEEGVEDLKTIRHSVCAA